MLALMKEHIGHLLLVGKGRILVMLCMLGAVGVQIIMFSIRVPAVMFFIIGVACQGFD